MALVLAKAANDDAHVDDCRVAVSTWIFRVVVAVIVCFHVCNAAFLAGVASLYWYITTPNMVYFVPTLNLPPVPILRAIMAPYSLLSVLHVYSLARILVDSIHERRLCLQPIDSPDTASSKTATTSTITPTPTLQRCCCFAKRWLHDRKPRILLAWLTNASMTLKFWWWSCFSVESRHFELSFTLRETYEIALQTYQAYWLSVLISRPWINSFAVGSILLNCICTPLIHYYFARSRSSSGTATTKRQARVLYIACDITLDFCAAVVVPVLVFLPYWAHFDTEISDFANDLSYNEVWYTNAIQENRQLFITSTLDFVSSVLPHLTLLSGVSTIKRLLVVSPVVSPSARGNSTRVAPAPPPSSTNLLFRKRSAPSDSSRSQDDRAQYQLSPHILATRCLHIVSCCWGVFVVAAHILANHSSASPVTGCRLHNSAWFVTRYACPVMELDCHAMATTGSPSDTLDKLLQQLDPKSLWLLSFSHCSALEMPVRIRTFEKLYGLVGFNTTITRWDQAASLHRDIHRSLSFVQFVFVNFSDPEIFPVAMAHNELPVTLQDIEIHGSNLETLPLALDVAWQQLVTLFIEFTAVKIVPSTVLSLPNLQFLSLTGNRIESLPEDAFATAPLSVLHSVALSGNPLRVLPATISPAIWKSIQEFDLEQTQISDLPPWIVSWYGEQAESGDRILTAFGSPLCGQVGIDETVRVEICATDLSSSVGLVPVEIVASQRAACL